MPELKEMVLERKEVAQKARDMQAKARTEGRELGEEEMKEIRWCIARGERLSDFIETERAAMALDERTHAPHRQGQRPEPGTETNDGGVRTSYGKNPWGCFGDQLKAVADHSLGKRTDNRLFEVRAGTGIQEAVGSDGGFLVQPEFAQEVFKRSYETGQVSSRCRRVPIGAQFNSIKIPAINESSRVDGSRWGGVLSYWVGEGDTYTPTRPKFRLMDLVLKKLVGLAYATDEMLQDSQLLENIIMQAFSEEIGFKTDDGAINGLGGGMMLGILNAPALYSVAATSGSGARFLSTDAYNMYQHMWAKSRANAVWFINQEVETALNTMVTGTATVNQAVYLPPGAMSASPYGTLLGRPVIPIEQCAAFSTVGDVIFADMSQYVIADKGGMQMASSMHVQFLTDQQVFRFTYRVEGQPLWQLPLTPYKGGNITSPFVVVATRT